MAYPSLPEEPTFLEDDFIFLDDEEIPEHAEDLPEEKEQSRLLWGIEDRSAVAYDQTQVVAINLCSVGLAEMMARARLRKIEALQPSSVTGGQAEGGIQDHVTIVHPYNYSNTTRFNPSLEELFGHSAEQHPTTNVLVLPTERAGVSYQR
jgi:hypothetical protein